MGQKRKRKKVLIAAACALVFIGATIIVHEEPGSMISGQRVPASKKFSSATGSLALIIEPRDGLATVLAAIRGASSSVDLVMYELEDQQVESALAVAAEHGVAVRVLLNGGYHGPSASGAGATVFANPNNAAYAFFQAHGVAVRWTPSRFALTHEKAMVVDAGLADRRAFILSFNFTPKYYSADRDFGIIDSASNDVAEVGSAFNADWNDKNIADPVGVNTSDLVWSPGSRPALLALIANAKYSLDIYNEEMGDSAITQALAQAAARGITVRVDMTYSSEWSMAFKTLTAVGAQVRTYGANAPLYIHAKMVLADGDAENARAFIGSENFSPTSLDLNRELGIVVADQGVVRSLSRTFGADWQDAVHFTSADT